MAGAWRRCNWAMQLLLAGPVRYLHRLPESAGAFARILQLLRAELLRAIYADFDALEGRGEAVDAKLLFRASTYFSAGASVSLSSPPACISSRMSCPPTSSPSTYSCGMVGQSLNVFSTFRRFPLFASSSVSIVS